MSEVPGNSVGLNEKCKAGPDIFSFYASEIAALLSQDENVLPSSNGSELSQGKYGVINGKDAGSLFENSTGDGLSDTKKKILKGLLRRSVNDLSLEVDEMLDPVLSMCQLRCKLRNKSLVTSPSNGEAAEGATKKAKISSCSSPGASGNSCPTKSGPCEEEDDLEFLLKNDNQALVEETVKKYSDELLSTLVHMEQKLEKILDAVTSNCRPMTRSEKRQLQKLIQKLPKENLVRIVEIIRHSRPAGEPSEEVFVDLEKEENVTLWRLYYYVEAVEKAKMLAHSQCS